MLVSEAMENEALAHSLLDYTISIGEDRAERLKEGLIVFSIMLQLFSTDSTQEEEPPFLRLLCENIPFFVSVLRIIPPTEIPNLHPSVQLEYAEKGVNLQSAVTALASEIDGAHTLMTSAGIVNPTFGTLRLQVADFFCALIFCGFPVLQAYPTEFQDLFPVCVDLLFHYKWNNILHNVLTRILSAVFEQSNEDSIVEMFESTHLLKRLVIAFSDYTPTGNKGHLLQLCQESLRASQNSSKVAEYTYNVPVWEEFVAGRLEELLSEQEPAVEDDGWTVNGEQGGEYEDPPNLGT